MGEPSAAAQVQTELDKVTGMLKPHVDRFDSRVAGDTVSVDVVATDQQLKAIANMLGGAFGP